MYKAKILGKAQEEYEENYTKSHNNLSFILHDKEKKISKQAEKNYIWKNNNNSYKRLLGRNYEILKRLSQSL